MEKVYVREGDRVSRGQVLAILEQADTDANLLSAKGSFLDAQTSLRKAETDLQRYEKLYATGAVSQQVVDDYRFARDNAAAKLEAARGSMRAMESKSEGTVLTAPADGIIAKRYYQEGYYAKAGTPIFAVADISMLKTTIHIPEGQIAGVHVGNEASSVDNSEGLLAGVYANVTLTASPKADVLTIPVQAIVMRDDQQTVFVVDDKGVVQRRVLNVGYTNDKLAEIVSGLDEKDTIVIEGHNKLREGSRIDLKKAGK